MNRFLRRWGLKKNRVGVERNNTDCHRSHIDRTSLIFNQYDNSMDISLCALESLHANQNGVFKNITKKQSKKWI